MSNQSTRLGIPIPSPVSDRIDAAAQAMSTVMAHVSLGAHGNQFERALSGLRAVQCLTNSAMPHQPPRALLATVMQDDSGEQPVFSLMVAYRSDLDAVAAMAMLHMPPVGYVRADQAYSVSQLYEDLEDVWREANAVDTTIGRPDALMKKLTRIRDAVANAANGYLAGRDALTHAELLEVKRAIAEFDDCNETDVPYALLMRAAHAGYLNCTYFEPADKEALDRDIAAAEQEPANA